MIAPDTIWRDARIGLVDCETTGLGADDRIVELAIVIGERGVIVGKHHWLLNPGRPIPEEATAIHKIKDADVVRAPTFAEIAVEVALALEGAIPAAYNSGFDRRFIAAAWREASLPALPWFLSPECVWLDPLVIARRIQKYAKGKRLGDVAARLGIEGGELHRATADATLALEVLYAFAKNKNLPDTYEDMAHRQQQLAAEQEADLAAWRSRQASEAAR